MNGTSEDHGYCAFVYARARALRLCSGILLHQHEQRVHRSKRLITKIYVSNRRRDALVRDAEMEGKTVTANTRVVEQIESDCWLHFIESGMHDDETEMGSRIRFVLIDDGAVASSAPCNSYTHKSSAFIYTEKFMYGNYITWPTRKKIEERKNGKRRREKPEKDDSFTCYVTHRHLFPENTFHLATVYLISCVDRTNACGRLVANTMYSEFKQVTVTHSFNRMHFKSVQARRYRMARDKTEKNDNSYRQIDERKKWKNYISHWTRYSIRARNKCAMFRTTIKSFTTCFDTICFLSLPFIISTPVQRAHKYIFGRISCHSFTLADSSWASWFRLSHVKWCAA